MLRLRPGDVEGVGRVGVRSGGGHALRRAILCPRLTGLTHCAPAPRASLNGNREEKAHFTLSPKSLDGH